MDDERPIFVDLFCGCGGASLGYERAGLRAALAIDASNAAVVAYATHSPGVAFALDLREARAEGLEERLEGRLAMGRPALVHASPPCTDFSSAGPRHEGASAELSVIATELACAMRPRVFVLENVPAFLASRAFERCRAHAATAGYDSVAFELDASLYGVPQVRRRAFWIGAPAGACGRLEAAARAVHAAAAPRPTTVAAALGATGTVAPVFFWLPPRGAQNRGVHSSALPAPTLRTNCANAMPADYARRTVDAAEPGDATRLDLAQLASLQGLPCAPPAASRSAAGRLIGNALPPPLTEALARALLTQGLIGASVPPASVLAGPGGAVRFVGATEGLFVSGPGRDTLSRRGARRQSHIALFAHARFVSDEQGRADASWAENEEEEETEDAKAEDETQKEPARQLQDTTECAALSLSRVRGARRLVVTAGRCDQCDAVAGSISGAPLPSGWRLEVRARTRTAFRRDDLYWHAPFAASALASTSTSASASASNTRTDVRAIRSRSAFLGACGVR
jgi:DNA (cytosine-5)-methyltransferase 1